MERQYFYPPEFHPDQVICIVDDPHLVGFGIADAEACFVFMHAKKIIAERVQDSSRLIPSDGAY